MPTADNNTSETHAHTSVARTQSYDSSSNSSRKEHSGDMRKSLWHDRAPKNELVGLDSSRAESTTTRLGAASGGAGADLSALFEDAAVLSTD